MYWEGGALLLTLSGQPCSRMVRSSITFAVSECRPAVHPVPDHSSVVADGPSVRGGSSAVLRGPTQTWKRQLPAQDCSGDGAAQHQAELLAQSVRSWRCYLL